MKLLLDTHALLWWWGEPELLSHRVRALLTQPDQEVVVSAASAWEIATKVRIGKLPKAGLAAIHYHEWLTEDGFNELPIAGGHAIKAGSIKSDHRDPFDRMLAAQAILEDLNVVTRDPSIRSLGAPTIW